MPHHMIGPVDIMDFPDHAHAFLIRWAPHWYNAVCNSTGFADPTPFTELDNEAHRIADACRADYEQLKPSP